MIRNLLLFALLATGFSGFSQDSTAVKSNLVLFAEIYGGFGGGTFGGANYGLTGNVQIGKHLFTGRWVRHSQLSAESLYLPAQDTDVDLKLRITEVAALYGWRFVENATSYSFSLGISGQEYREKLIFDDVPEEFRFSTEFGLAYEVNVKWFKKKRQPYRVAYIAPVGPPTGFGRSFGFKLVGNVSKHYYFGIGMTLGLGWHKRY